LVEVLAEVPEQVPTSSAAMAARMVAKGFTEAQMATGLGYISHQFGKELPQETAGLRHSISVLAQRSKSGGIVTYGLTPVRRIAAQRVLAGACR
jgi:hypothetical protein